MEPIFKYLKGFLCKGDSEYLRKPRQMVEVSEKWIPTLYKEHFKTIRIAQTWLKL